MSKESDGVGNAGGRCDGIGNLKVGVGILLSRARDNLHAVCEALHAGCQDGEGITDDGGGAAGKRIGHILHGLLGVLKTLADLRKRAVVEKAGLLCLLLCGQGGLVQLHVVQLEQLLS